MSLAGGGCGLLYALMLQRAIDALPVDNAFSRQVPAHPWLQYMTLSTFVGWKYKEVLFDTKDEEFVGGCRFAARKVWANLYGSSPSEGHCLRV